MSNRPPKHLLREAYFTPKEVVWDLLKIGILKGVTSILEPCAGTGNIVETLRWWDFDHHITAIEIDSDYVEILAQTKPTVLIQEDFFSPGINKTSIGTFDLVIINPPYSQIERFIEKSYTLINDSGKLAVLLRLAHLVGIRRGHFLAKYVPSAVHLLCSRPAFSGSASDIGGYAWVIFDKPMVNNQPTTLHWIQRNQ